MQETPENTEKLALSEVIEAVPGRVHGAAKVCGVSVRAVYKWLVTGRLPRTDYTGETQYASQLSAAVHGRFSASQILSCSKVNSVKG